MRKEPIDKISIYLLSLDLQLTNNKREELWKMSKKIGLGTIIGFLCFLGGTKLAHVLIYWDKYIGGPYIFDPDGGWFVELCVKYIGWDLDELIGFTFFSPIISWILGAISYVPLYFLAFMYLSYVFAARNLPTKAGIPIYIVTVIFFMAVYYFHVLDHNDFFYYYFSMADTDSVYVKSYV